MTGPVVVLHRNGWRVTSWGNGWAYLLEYIPDNTSLWMQDEAATEFAEDTMEHGFFRDDCEQRFADLAPIMEAAAQ